MTQKTRFVCISAILMQSAMALGQYDLTWNTVDGGGGRSTGGSFTLDGTIGQHDAGPGSGPMMGGQFSLVGGFWPSAVTSCSCLGDVNGDGSRNGADVQSFVDCLTAVGSCACADVDESGDVTLDDLGVFVVDLLAGSACP